VAHRSLLDPEKVVDRPRRSTSKRVARASSPASPAPSLPEVEVEVEAPKPVNTIKSSKWGTVEEKHRWLCLLSQLCRYSYYCHGVSIVADTTYDALENLIRDIERSKASLVDRRYSPTRGPGSDKEETYPLSVRDVWEAHKDDKVWDVYDKMMQSTIAEALKN